MSFKNACLGAAVLFFSLGMSLIFIPELLYWLFALKQNELGDFLAKRAGMLFLGFSVLFFYARRFTSSDLKFVLSLAISVAMGGMAFLGLYEFVRGFAGQGILIAIFIEFLIVAVFIRFVIPYKSDAL